LTYQELNTRANQLAPYLRQPGVGPDVLVGLCLEQFSKTSCLFWGASIL
jgi:non-ribosomal peptide synthetase component F